MILKTCFLLMLSVAWEVSGASFSKVYMQTGPEGTAPVEYLNYAAPSYAYNGHEIAQLAAAPVGFEYPLTSSFAYGAPCNKNGCFYPGPAIASVAEVNPSGNIVEFNPPIPNVPVVYAASPNEQAGYTYSYVVLDQGTGDHKVHSELSDGEVVRGDYSFLQPDGLVREVQYVANDMQGFNAIISNLVPAEEVKHTETTHHTLPCHERKSEALTIHEAHEEAHHETHKAHHEEHVVHHEEHVGHHEEHESRHGSHEESVEQEGAEEESELEEISEEHQENNSAEGQVEHHSSVEEPDKHTHEKLKAHEHHEHEEKPTHEKLEIHEGHTHEHLILAPHEHHGSHLESHQAVTQEHGVAESDVFVSYNDIIKCIQAAMTKAKNHPSAPRSASPLTYLIFNKPC